MHDATGYQSAGVSEHHIVVVLGPMVRPRLLRADTRTSLWSCSEPVMLASLTKARKRGV